MQVRELIFLTQMALIPPGQGSAIGFQSNVIDCIDFVAYSIKQSTCIDISQVSFENKVQQADVLATLSPPVMQTGVFCCIRPTLLPFGAFIRPMYRSVFLFACPSRRLHDDYSDTFAHLVLSSMKFHF